MRKIWNLVGEVFLVWMLVGCGVSTTVERPDQPQPEPLVNQQTPASVVVTLRPASTSTQDNTPLSQPTLPLIVSGEATPTPAADSTGIHIANQGQPWKDCDRATGWAGCDPQAPTLAGRVAFADPNLPALVVLDLQGSTAWSAGGYVDLLDWSPGADRLLVGLGENQYLVYDSDGNVLEQFTSPMRPSWQPDDSLAREGQVRSAQGDEARLEATASGIQLVVKAGNSGEEQIFDLRSPSADMLYQLVGWVPGTNMVLGQVSTGGNAAMVQGGRLFTFDTATGTRKDMDASAPLGWNAAFAWKPGSGVLAFLETAHVESGLPALAILDLPGGEIRYPLPEGIEMRALDWQPSGEHLAFAAVPWGQNQGFDRPGIYLLDSLTTQVQALTQPPNGASDHLPRWMADSDTLLFVRRFGNGVLEIRAARVSDGQEWVIVSGLPVLCDTSDFGCHLQRWAAIGRLP